MLSNFELGQLSTNRKIPSGTQKLAIAKNVTQKVAKNIIQKVNKNYY
jgi:hypothetical protein